MLGVINVFAFAPYGWFLLPIFTLIGLVQLFTFHPRRAVWLGWLYGLGFFSAGISWLYISLHVYGGMNIGVTLLTLFLFSSFLALFPALFGWAYQVIGIRSAVGLASVWVLQEWMRSWIFTGFPWLTLGYSQIPNSVLLGYAPIFGVFGVSFLLAWTSFLITRINVNRIILIVIIWLIGGLLQTVQWTKPIGPLFSVALLQGNINQDTKWRAEALTDTLVGYERMVLASQAQLIILPETAFPVLYPEIPVSFLNILIHSVQQHHGDLLVGIPEQTTEGRYYNSLMSMGSSPLQVYRKSHLVPFGEYIPLKSVFGQLLRLLNVPMSDFSRGAAQQPALHVSGQNVAADICYEDAFGNEIIRSLPNATILVNVTNDAWFGSSSAPWQHLQMSQMRAIETGRYMLRATNTGVTAIISPHGKVMKYLPIYTRAVLNGIAQGYQGATPYYYVGNVLIILGALILLLVEGRFTYYQKPDK